MGDPRLQRAKELAAQESGLAVAVTCRPDGTPHASVVNAGVLEHPVTGEEIVGFVARGYARKLVHLRAQPAITVLWRSGWEWIAVDGLAELAGPDDRLDGLDDDGIPVLLRTVYAAAVGGSADDWAALDADMARERHAAVLVRAQRVYSNPPV